MERQTPDRSRETRIAIVPASEAKPADSDPLCSQGSDHASPHGVEIRRCTAGLRETDQAVESPLPACLGFVSKNGSLPFASFGITILEFDPNFERVGCERSRERGSMLKKILNTGADH
jgi:hypothetical protein